MCNITKITYFQALINIISFFSSDRSQEKNTFNISWNFNNFKLKNFNIKKNLLKIPLKFTKLLKISKITSLDLL